MREGRRWGVHSRTQPIESYLLLSSRSREKEEEGGIYVVFRRKPEEREIKNTFMGGGRRLS